MSGNLDRLLPPLGIYIHQESVHRQSLIKRNMSIGLSLPPSNGVIL